MKRLHYFLNQKHKSKGQSLMEMTLVVGVLMILAMGAVEFGYLLNQYINLVDGTREGARYASNQDPYAVEDSEGNITYDYTKINDNFFPNIIEVVDNNSSEQQTDENLYRGAISPLILNSTTDELMVYFLSIRENQNFEVSKIECQFDCVKHGKDEALVNAKHDFITESLDINAPNTGIVVVEIFYAYNQLLSLPIFTAFVPDPIQVHAYSIMPLSAAEPTPVIGP